MAVEIPAAALALAALISSRGECFPAGTPSALSQGELEIAPPVVGGGAAQQTLTYATPGAAGEYSGAPAAGEAGGGDGSAWWYSASGEQVGPVTGAALAAMLASGEVTAKTWVFEEGSSDWQELDKARGRLPALATL